jgi:hypothetical protein
MLRDTYDERGALAAFRQQQHDRQADSRFHFEQNPFDHCAGKYLFVAFVKADRGLSIWFDVPKAIGILCAAASSAASSCASFGFNSVFDCGVQQCKSFAGTVRLYSSSIEPVIPNHRSSAG